MRLLFLHACEIKLRGGLGVRLEYSIHTQTEVGPPLTHTHNKWIFITDYIIVADSFDTQLIGYQHIFFIH